MAQKQVIVVGAGLIGAMVAYQLTRQGAAVTIVEAGQPAQAASGRSFGWINAGYYLDKPHHHLRVAGIEAWHRLGFDLPELPVSWCGCLAWDVTGDALEAQLSELAEMGYPAQQLGPAEIVDKAPALRGDIAEAVWFPTEGVANPGQAAWIALQAAQDAGARLITGTPVSHVIEEGGQVRGVAVPGGQIRADYVVLAGGNGTPALLDPFDVALPMLTRPGALMRSRAVPPLLKAIMVSPDLEFRQDAQGRIIAPSAASHQADEAEALDAAPPDLADDTLRRLRHWLPDVALEWEEITLAMRPVPGDGRPVVGPCGLAGLSVAVMHSGVTLGALMGEWVAQEVLTGQTITQLGPYRPQRFEGAMQ